MSDAGGACATLLMTALRPGAVAILQLEGDVVPRLLALTGVRDWPVGRCRLADLGGIDRGLAGRIAEGVAQIMPHGGPRLVQRLVRRLEELGAPLRGGEESEARDLYPEASDPVEALALGAIARAASPLAIDLLLDQARRWRERPVPGADDIERSRRLNRLIDPPRVTLAGPPNVGKSTLSNALLGRSMSITLDLPGTTRDYTWGRIDLAGLVVQWHDTPGLRHAADPTERRAIELARRLMESSDLLIAITDGEHDWPDLPRPPDLRVASKADRARRHDGDLAVSALSGAGLADLVRAVRDRLVPPADLAHPGPWLFDARLGECNMKHREQRGHRGKGRVE